jgi:hypothetical protein
MYTQWLVSIKEYSSKFRQIPLNAMTLYCLLFSGFKKNLAAMFVWPETDGWMTRL